MGRERYHTAAGPCHPRQKGTTRGTFCGPYAYHTRPTHERPRSTFTHDLTSYSAAGYAQAAPQHIIGPKRGPIGPPRAPLPPSLPRENPGALRSRKGTPCPSRRPEHASRRLLPARRPQARGPMSQASARCPPASPHPARHIRRAGSRANRRSNAHTHLMMHQMDASPTTTSGHMGAPRPDTGERPRAHEALERGASLTARERAPVLLPPSLPGHAYARGDAPRRGPRPDALTYVWARP